MMNERKIEKRLPEQPTVIEQKADELTSAHAFTKPHVVRSPNVLSKEELDAKEIFEQNKKVSDELVDKIFLLLKGLSYSKSKSILQKAISKLAQTAILHI